jgi:hypothetical protein
LIPASVPNAPRSSARVYHRFSLDLIPPNSSVSQHSTLSFFRSPISHAFTSDIEHQTSDISAASGIHQRAEIRSQLQRKIKTGIGKIMSLSIETKVAIAVATSFVLLVVGAMAQG